MKNYKIYSEKKDFTIDENVRNLTGTRTKKMVFMNSDKSKAMIKYNKYLNCTELASEKIAYEIAKVLKFKCAKIELAIDKDGTLGILNYYFLKKGTVHSDALFYLRKMGNDRSEYHNLKNVLNFLEAQNKQVVNDFLKIMLFDSLIGEQDRHEENWGITKSLNDNYGKKYKHFALIDELLNIYPDQMKKIIKNLKKLNDKKVEDIVNAMPKNYLSEKHKKCIIIFIKKINSINIGNLCNEF